MNPADWITRHRQSVCCMLFAVIFTALLPNVGLGWSFAWLVIGSILAAEVGA